MIFLKEAEKKYKIRKVKKKTSKKKKEDSCNNIKKMSIFKMVKDDYDYIMVSVEDKRKMATF